MEMGADCTADDLFSEILTVLTTVFCTITTLGNKKMNENSLFPVRSYNIITHYERKEQ